MASTSLLTPILAMVALTFIIGFIAVSVRFSSVKSGQVRARYYKLMAGSDVPEIVTKTTRSFNNQFEVPVLFYLVVILYIQFGIQDFLTLVLAWAFVAARYVHAYIHITYNHVLHRLSSFWLSCMCLLGMWINLALMVY